MVLAFAPFVDVALKNISVLILIIYYLTEVGDSIANYFGIINI